MLDFNISEMATRLKRGLSVRGRIPLTLDETNVGTYQLLNMDATPWRTTGRAFGTGGNITPTVGRFAGITLTNSGPKPMVIKRLVIQNSGVAVMNLSCGFGNVIGAAVNTFGGMTGEVAAQAFDSLAPPTQLAIDINNNVLLRTYDVVASLSASQAIPDVYLQLAPSGQLVLEQADLTLSPSQLAGGTSYIIASNTVTQSLLASFSVLVYD